MRRMPAHMNTVPGMGTEEAGLALFFIIGLCLGLVTVVLLFAHAASLEYQAAGNAVAAHQATQAIEGARRYVEFVLENVEEPGCLPALDTYAAEQAPVGEGMFWLLGKDPDDPDQASLAFSLVDEASKLNLNTATLEMLEALPEMTPEFAAAIIDWRDADSDLTDGGAESANYVLLDPPYLCKNGSFETVEELRMVYGAELDALRGEDMNHNHILDENENDGDVTPPDDDADGQLDLGLLDYFTVYSSEPNTDSEGNERVNINTADRSELERVFEEALGDKAAQVLQSLPGGRSSFDSLLDFYLSSGLSKEDFALVEDKLTVSDEDKITGLVNVNTASEEVLACIPGIGLDLAQQLVAYRLGKGEDELQSIAWVAEVLEDNNARLAGPHLTVCSYQFTADVVAVGRNARGLQRSRFVFDASSGDPLVVARKDMGRAGWPLDSESRRLSSERFFQ
jgi:DNA uptake protein ComE-like DNA-binding protein